MNRLTLPVASLAALITSLSVAPAFGQQSRPERPYRGLFGGGGDSSDLEQSLSVSGSIGAGYDTSVLAEAGEAGFGTGSAGRRSEEGGFTLLSEGLTYSLNKKQVGVSATQSASARFYPTLERSSISNYSGAIGASWAPSARTNFSANQAVTYQPINVFALFPVFGTTPLGEVYLADLDYGTVDAGYFTYQTTVGASRKLSARTTVSGDYFRDRSDFAALYPDFSSDRAGGRVTHGLTSGLALRLGYTYTRTEYGGDERFAGRHGIDSGVDYHKTFSFSRRTSLSFSTGGTAMTYQGGTYVNAIGSARLTHEIGRTWAFNVAYDRNVGFVETFAAPVAYDAASVSLGGLIDRRWSFHSSAGATIGALGLGATASQNGFNSYYANAGVSRALSRHLSFGVDYSFYQYDYEETATLLPNGYNTDMSRNSVRATLNAWLPLFQRGRRSNAPR